MPAFYGELMGFLVFLSPNLSLSLSQTLAFMLYHVYVASSFYGERRVPCSLISETLIPHFFSEPDFIRPAEYAAKG